MARRSRRSGTSKDKLSGALLGIVGVMLIVALAGGGYWLKTTQVVLDKDTNCPQAGPRAVHVIMFDRSDAVSEQQAQRIRQVVQKFMANAVFATRFDVYTFEGDTENVLQPTLAICVPPRPEEASDYTSNVGRLRKRFEDRFTAVLGKAMDGLLTTSKRPTSPIIESLRAAAQTSFGPYESGDIPLRLTLISDMVQHSVVISHFRSEPNFDQLSHNPDWPRLRPQLKGAETEILYLLRPTAVRGTARVQNRGHQAFWEQLITEAGGKILSIVPF